MTDISDIKQLDWSAFWRVMPRILIPSRRANGSEALEAVVENEGRERATYLLRKLLDHARDQRVPMPPVLNTPYRNTIPLAEQPPFPATSRSSSA